MSFEEIVKNGTFYEDARDRSKDCIVCDRCFDTNLKSCYSYLAKDLCLKCVEQIKKLQTKSSTPIHDVNFDMTKKDKLDESKLYYMSPGIINNGCVTKMRSARFFSRTNSSAITLMRSDRFNSGCVIG
jgi:hypothetical protein